jgi:roadblock/LC7 domain-containing protein
VIYLLKNKYYSKIKGEKMIGLDHLMKKPGVIAAGQFTEKGKPLRSAGDLSESMLLMAAKMSQNNYKKFSEEINEFYEATGQGCQRINGWGLWCDKYAICAVGRTMAFVDTAKVDFNQLMVDLCCEEPTGSRQMNY